MTEKERATEIVLKYYLELKESTYDYYDEPMAVKCAIIHVKGIIEVAKPDPYPRKKTQMDREYWQRVLTELNQM